MSYCSFALFTVLQLAFQQCKQVTEADGTAAVAIPMLSLRLLSNCFRGGPGSLEAVASQLDRYVIQGDCNSVLFCWLTCLSLAVQRFTLH